MSEVEMRPCLSSVNLQKNRLLQAGTTSFSYDNEGQLATKTGSTFTFDDAHRVTGISGTTSQQYRYDGANNRLESTRNGATTRYIYDAAGNLLAEADGSNSITRYYIHGAGLMAMVTSGNQLYAYHFDGTGHTVAMTNDSANIVNAYAYTPFGTIGNQQETIPQPFKYVGQYGVMSEPNGLYYMRARYYDSSVGRFISEVPLGFDGGDVNLMAYVANNPVMLVDPSGEWIAQAIGGTIGAVAGGVAAYLDGGSIGDIARSAAVGGAAGVLSTIPIPGINPLMGGTAMSATAGFVGNVGTQVASGTDLADVDFRSAAISAGAGAVGGGLGAKIAARTTKQVVSGTLGNAIRKNPTFTKFGQSVIGASTGGVSAAVLDVGAHKLH